MSENDTRNRAARSMAAGLRSGLGSGRSPRDSGGTAKPHGRTRILAAFLLASGWFAGAANAQRLWSVGEVEERPLPPIEVGVVVVASPATAGVAGPLTAETAAVQVEFDYLRLGMGYLELPLLDGSVIEAENAVFEDRGGGNFLWTGEVPGAGYESVLFTVQDGHLVGWFGEPGGPKYTVHAGPDGRGTLSVETGPTGDWCGVEAEPRDELELVRGAARAPDRPVPVASEANDNRLDILVLYTGGAERYWRPIGGLAVGVQQFSDYLNMVFRNGEIPATANLVPVRWDPEFNHPSMQGQHYRHPSIGGITLWHQAFESSAEVVRLRKRYAPDLIHFVTANLSGFIGGFATVRSHLDPYVLRGMSVAHPLIFAHEIGHNLGGNHEPEYFGDFFLKVRSLSFRPYSFAHTDLTSCSEHPRISDLLTCPKTVISYGVAAYTDGGPRRIGVLEPFYSSTRHKPNGWTIGIAGEREVERVFHETVPVAVRSGEAPYRAEQQYPRTISARWTGRDSVRLTWPEEFPVDASVWLALAEGANDRYVLVSDPNYSDDNVTPVLNDGSLVGVDIAGLRPAGRYRISARGPQRWADDGFKICCVRSDVFLLKAPGRAAGSPARPSNVGAQLTGPDSVRLSWRDNSSNETGFEIWYRKWSGEEPDEVWRRYGEPLPARTRSADINDLAAEEEIRITVHGEKAMVGRYSFVVVAYNDSGFGASDTFELEFMPGPYAQPTASGEITDCTRNGPTGLDLDGFWVYACLETPDGARRRAWDYRLDADQSGLLYFFDRDNVEILVKVLDGCAINGHRWVFVAPVTTLGFRLMIRRSGKQIAGSAWNYDSERRTEQQILGRILGNPVDRTARTVSDTTAFPCTAAEIAAVKAGASGAGGDYGQTAPSTERPLATPATSPVSLASGARTDCVPGGPALTLRGGYKVSMCYETDKGEIGDARDWGLGSTQSGLLYFFERDNVEVLIKVLDGCGVNGHRWVFVAPVTTLAFNLHVESPDGKPWTHTNRLNQTADTRSDTSAFGCSSSA